MRIPALLLVCITPLVAAAAEDFFDRVDEMLTLSALNDRARLRLSGTLDLEYYHTPRPPIGRVNSNLRNLFNPRLSLFVDAQLCPHFYAFAQARVDHGYDPGDSATQVRMDEYALRITPWEDSRFNFQIGKFSPVIGNWMTRHLSWDNPFVTGPMPYENAQAVSDIEVPENAREFAGDHAGDPNYEYLPIVWSAAYATGISVSGNIGKFDYAAELKNASLSSRPESWSATDRGFERPTFSARLGWRPSATWNLGFSASRGPYLAPEIAPELPAGSGLRDYEQFLLAQDISFAWGHLQIWAEFFQARFEVPHVGKADTFSYYVEAKYKFSPEFFAAVRWNQQFFAGVSDGEGGRVPWARDVWRADVALGYRFTAHTQLKLQYSLEHETAGSRGYRNMIAAQFTLRF